jgi:arylsulfatase A-like enzyme
MRCVMVMFDSLNRHLLPPYNASTFIHAPNFQRLAARSVTFDRSYVCSMPCMPARRDLHTGRPNFLHRSWGPLEPFDDSMPQMLKQAGVHSALMTDHYHYFEDGGGNYHCRYSTWQFFRGQEGDPWMGQVADPSVANHIGRNASQSPVLRQDRVNRLFMRRTQDLPQAHTFDAGIDFIRRNQGEDRWMVQIETFDPHEPFFSHRRYQDLYPEHYEAYRRAGGPVHDWPDYNKVTEPPEQVEHLRHEYASLVSLCDEKLGDVLDLFDELDLWQDTMLVVWTDHGFLLGEHESWAKVWQPFYQEVAHTPFFVWDPRSGRSGVRCDALVQPSIDLAPTLLRYFGLAPTADMLGHDLGATIARGTPVREAAMFGLFGAQVNVTDGRYVYMRGPASADNAPLFQHTFMPAHMRQPFHVTELHRLVDLAPPFRFTKGCSTMRLASPTTMPSEEHYRDKFKTLLFDLQRDPGQREPMQDAAVEQRMTQHLLRLMREADAPVSQYQRLGLPLPA